MLSAGSHKLWFDLHRRRHPDVNQRRDDWTDTDDPALCRGDRYSASLPHDLHVGCVIAHPTAAFMDFIAAHNISFEQAAAARQRDGGEHNRRETPLYAQSIAHR